MFIDDTVKVAVNDDIVMIIRIITGLVFIAMFAFIIFIEEYINYIIENLSLIIDMDILLLPNPVTDRVNYLAVQKNLKDSISTHKSA